MRIIINEMHLSEGQTVAVWTAIGDFLSTLLVNEDACGDDEHGKLLRQVYIARLQEVSSQVMVSEQARKREQ